jgi:hypothetical protein
MDVSMLLYGMIGLIAGGIGGLFIGRFFQKRTGGVCPILCNPKISTIYFAVLGFIIGYGR